MKVNDFENINFAFDDLFEREARTKEEHARKHQSHFHNTKDSNSDYDGGYRREQSSFWDYIFSESRKWSMFDEYGRPFSADYVKDNEDGTFTTWDDGFFGQKNKRTHTWGRAGFNDI